MDHARKSAVLTRLSGVLPWRNPSEKKVNEILAAQICDSLVPLTFFIEQAFSMINDTALTVEQDTGLNYLAAVLNKPKIESYSDSSRWKSDGYWSEKICNTEDRKLSPRVNEVLDGI